MTRMIFFPGEGSFLVMDSPIPAAELARAVNAGEWTLPAPYTFLCPEGMQATFHDEVVVVTLSKPAAAAPEGFRVAPVPVSISIRQQEVLLALADGLTTRQIARRLGVTPRMVLYHVARIKTAFGSLSRAQSVGKAASLGLVRPKGKKKEV